MKKSSLNRKFRRALAASLGAVAFASTSSVINAVDPMLYRQRELANVFGNLGDAHVNILNTGKANYVNAIAEINIRALNMKAFAVNGAYQEMDNVNHRDARVRLTWGGIDYGFVRLKNADMVGYKRFRLMPDDDKAFNTIPKVGGVGIGAASKVNRGTREYWKTFHDTLDTQIKNLEKAEADAAAKRAEENAKAERERANSLFSSSGSQPAQTAPINNTATLATSALTAMIPMTTMMNNTTPVQTTTSSLVNTGNTMGTQVGPKADINNTNSQINHNANVVEGKTKT